MRSSVLLAPLAAAGFLLQAQAPTPQLDRLAREAQTFSEQAQNVIGEETLTQKVAFVGRRFLRLRIGQDALKRPKVEYRERKVISEYSFATYKTAPGDLFELREVVEADGKQGQSHLEARRRLYSGLKSESDQIRKKMLEDFQQYGLEGAVTGLGQSILLFRRPGIGKFRFEPAGTQYIGDDEMAILRFRQVDGGEAFTVFENHRVLKLGLEGRIWIRKSDHLPRRIEFRNTRQENGAEVEDVATVEYEMSKYGVLLPAWAQRDQTVNGELAETDHCHYEKFRMFSSKSDIEFDTDPEPETQPVTPSSGTVPPR